MIKFNLRIIGTLCVLLFVGCVKADRHEGAKDFGPTAVETNSAGGRSAGKRNGQNDKFSVGGLASDQVLDLSQYAKSIYISQDIRLISANDVSVQSEDARFPNKRHYHFALPITDLRASGNPLIGAKFTLYSELGVGRDVEVAQDGLIHWDEYLEYNFISDSVNLEVNFILIAKNGPKAVIHRRIKLNPWDKKRGANPEFQDITNVELNEDYMKQTWAYGAQAIFKALAGRLTSKQLKRLVVGNLSRRIVDKNIYVHSTTNKLLGQQVDDIFSKQIMQPDVTAEEHIDDVVKSVQFEKQQEGVDSSAENALNQTLDLHLQLDLSDIRVRVYDSAGQFSPQKIGTGRYKIETQLLATDLSTDQPQYIISDNLPMSRNWKQDEYGVRAVLPLSVVMRPTWGNLALAIKVTPLDLQGVAPFEALYHLGRFNNLMSSGSAGFDLSEYTVQPRTELLEFEYDAYLKRAGNYTAWNDGHAAKLENLVNGLQNDFKRFEFGVMNVLFGRVMPGDTSTDRTVQYTVQSCVRDAATGQVLAPGQRFKITTWDRGLPTEMISETTPGGCLNWYGLISHKFFHREDLIRKISKVTFLGEPDATPVELDYYINPWDEKFTFGRDARVLVGDYLQQVKEQQKYMPETRILITDFDYTTIGFRYNIDKYMNLTVKKSVLLGLDPKVLKYNSIIFGRSGFQHLRDGVYLMKVALQKNYLDPAPRQVHDQESVQQHLYYDETSGKQMHRGRSEDLTKKEYLMVKQKLVRVLGGVVITPMQFEISDLRLMRIRNHFLIQFETIDESLLRQMALISSKLGKQSGEEVLRTQKTIEILEGHEAEELKLLEEAKLATDEALVAERLAALDAEKREKLAALYEDLNDETRQLTEEKINALRKAGQGAKSIVSNEKFRALGAAVKRIKKTLRTHSREALLAKSEEYKVQKEQECDDIRKSLEANGQLEEAATYALGGENCRTNMDPEQSFYYNTSRDDIGSEKWLRDNLNPEDYELFVSGQLIEDFTTKSYEPDVDFDFLSNQGDELDPELARNEYDLELSEGNPVNTNVSGIRRRTFIGPITILRNDNGSALRPTDVLGEHDCHNDFTCSQLERVETRKLEKDVQDTLAEHGYDLRDMNPPVNGRYENSPHFGSVKHFRDLNVNDLIPRYNKVRALKSIENEFGGQLSNFLKMFRLDYVSLTDRNEGLQDIDFDCYLNVYQQVKGGNLNVRLKDCYGDRSSYAQSYDYFKDNFNNRGKKNFKKQPLVGKKPSPGLIPRLFSKKTPKLNATQIKEFTKNGMASVKLSIDDKFAFLHRMCFPLRLQMASKNLMTKDYGFWAKLMPKKRRGIREALNDFEDLCHETLGSFRKQYDEKYQELDTANMLLAEGKRKAPQELENMALSKTLIYSPMVLERKVLIKETSGQYFYKDGKSINYNVGASFNISHSKGLSRSESPNPQGFLEDMIGIAGDSFGILGDNPLSKFAGVISDFGEALVGAYKVNWSLSDGSSQSSGTSLSEGTYLAAQISTLDIELKKWEKCSVIRFRPEFQLAIINKLAASFDFYDPTKFVTGHGYMLCSGEDDTSDDLVPSRMRARQKDPLRIRERYIYFTQHFTEGDMQDPASLVNHPWMLQIRGLRDFATFVNNLKEDRGDTREFNRVELLKQMTDDIGDLVSILSGTRKETVNKPSDFEVINKQDLARPINMLAENYRKVLPTFPGMYTFIDAEGERVTNWPSSESDSAHNSFKDDE